VRPSDLDKYSLPAQCRLPMTEHDKKMGMELLKVPLSSLLHLYLCITCRRSLSSLCVVCAGAVHSEESSLGGGAGAHVAHGREG
jgi:hypothetical protein